MSVHVISASIFLVLLTMRFSFKVCFCLFFHLTSVIQLFFSFCSSRISAVLSIVEAIFSLQRMVIACSLLSAIVSLFLILSSSLLFSCLFHAFMLIVLSLEVTNLPLFLLKILEISPGSHFHRMVLCLFQLTTVRCSPPFSPLFCGIISLFL